MSDVDVIVIEAPLDVAVVVADPVVEVAVVTGFTVGPPGATIPASATFTVPGTLFAAPGISRFTFWDDRTILTVLASVATAPAGSSVIVDVNVNGVSIFTEQANRPTIPAGANADVDSTPDTTAVTLGDYLTIDVDHIGSTTAGGDLVVQIIYQ